MLFLYMVSRTPLFGFLYLLLVCSKTVSHSVGPGRRIHISPSKKYIKEKMISTIERVRVISLFLLALEGSFKMQAQERLSSLTTCPLNHNIFHHLHPQKVVHISIVLNMIIITTIIIIITIIISTKAACGQKGECSRETLRELSKQGMGLDNVLLHHHH